MHISVYLKKKYLGHNEYILQEGEQPVMSFQFLWNKVQKYYYIVS